MGGGHDMSSWKHPEQHPGAYLQKRFLEPLEISASQLSRATGMPRSRVSEILSGRRRITADTAARLGAYLMMEPEFWMSLQAAWELAQIQPTIPHIAPADPRGFLVGPAGAQRLERSPRPLKDPVARMSPAMLSRLRALAEATPAPAPAQHIHVVHENGQHAWISKPG